MFEKICEMLADKFDGFAKYRIYLSAHDSEAQHNHSGE